MDFGYPLLLMTTFGCGVFVELEIKLPTEHHNISILTALCKAKGLFDFLLVYLQDGEPWVCIAYLHVFRPKNVTIFNLHDNP